jgi:Flp pilus assembly protein CpaB
LNGAFSDPSTLRDKVATRDIYQGSQLTASDFASANTSAAASLTKNQRIIAVPFDSTHGDVANIQSGDHVDVYAMFNLTPVYPLGLTIGGTGSHSVFRMIMRNVNVLSVTKPATGNATYYFKVTDIQATKLAFASDNGKLWLALRPAANAKTSPPSVVTAETLMLGVKPQLVYRSLGGH